MNAVGWPAAGVAAGLAGDIAWNAIAYYANTEISFLAWGIGFLVGTTVRYVAYLNEVDGSRSLGTYAVAVTMGSVLFAKLSLYRTLVINRGLAGPIPLENMFSLFDVLWFGLAGITAFRIAARSYVPDKD